MTRPRLLSPAYVWCLFFLVTTLFFPYHAQANPVPGPSQYSHVVGSAVITLVSFGLEFIVAMALFKFAADTPPSILIFLALLGLNAFTYFLVLLPIFYLTSSIVLAELMVIAIEGAAYFFLLSSLASPNISWKKAYIFAAVANLSSNFCQPRHRSS